MRFRWGRRDASKRFSYLFFYKKVRSAIHHETVQKDWSYFGFFFRGVPPWNTNAIRRFLAPVDLAVSTDVVPDRCTSSQSSSSGFLWLVSYGPWRVGWSTTRQFYCGILFALHGDESFSILTLEMPSAYFSCSCCQFISNLAVVTVPTKGMELVFRTKKNQRKRREIKEPVKNICKHKKNGTGNRQTKRKHTEREEFERERERKMVWSDATCRTSICDIAHAVVILFHAFDTALLSWDANRTAVYLDQPDVDSINTNGLLVNLVKNSQRP